MNKPAIPASLRARSAFSAIQSACGGRPAPSPAVAGFRPAGLALAVAAAFLGAPQADAQPAGAQAIHGQASLSQQGSKLVVTTQNGAGTNHSAINWQSFSVPAGSTTHFQQPGATSLSINRVVGNDPSAIFGTLSSNGRLVLVNPSGIAVGAGAVVDTAGFTASTLRMSDANALAGRLVFGGDGLGGGALTVDGKILARSGDVVLIAPNVQVGSQALVQSPNGATMLAAGQKVELTGRGLEGIRLELQAPGDQALNLGTLQGDAVGIFAGQLKHSGLIQATGVSAEGGKVVLRASGDNLVDGRVQAKAGTKGGSIDVLGGQVALFGNASLDASGAQGGGQVRVGGDYQGANANVPNARNTFVGEDVAINADATANGDGGRVIVWADEATRFRGQISARGGDQGGNGGFAEVSGRQYLEYAGNADLRAPQGKAGTLLLDPNDITIQVGGTTDVSQTSGSPYLFGGGVSGSVVTKADLEAQLANSDVVIKTSTFGAGSGSGDITVAAPLTWGANALALEADRNISIQNTIDTTGMLVLITHAVNAGEGNVTQTSGGTISANELMVSTVAGGVTLTADNSVSKLAASANTFAIKSNTSLEVTSLSRSGIGALTGIAADGAISIQTTAGDITTSANVTSVLGAVTLDAAGSVRVNGTIDAAGLVTIQTSTGNITMDVANQIQAGAANLIAAGSILGNAVISTEGGNVLLRAGGGISFDNIASGTTKGMGGSAGSVTLEAGTGSITGNGIFAAGEFNSEGNGGAGGSVQALTTGGNITLGWISAAGGNGSFGTGGAGGSVSLRAPATGAGQGNITVSGGIDAFGAWGSGGGGAGGSVLISAGKDIQLMGVLSEGGDAGSFGSGSGGMGGSVALQSTAGSINVNNINAHGGSALFGGTGAGGAGGSVGLSANGTGAGQGNINVTGYLLSYGGDGVAGGNAGAVGVSAHKAIQIAGIDGYGGTANASFGAGGGGLGATIGLQSMTGSVTVDDGIYAYGGDGAPGGNGGIVRIQAAGDLTVPYVDVYGGYGNSGGNGANAGHGGTIAINVGGNLSVYDLHAGGGWGENGVNGGAGGNGGSISIANPNGSLTLSNAYLDVGGGGGGSTNSLGSGGAGGQGGTIAVGAAGALTLQDMSMWAAGGSGGYDASTGSAPYGFDGTIQAFAPGGVSIGGYVYFDGLWANSGTINISGSAGIYGGGLFVNSGEVNLSDSAYLNPYGGIENRIDGRINALSGTVYAGLGTNQGVIDIAAGATLEAPNFYQNDGKVRVNGTLSISGYYSCECETSSLSGGSGGGYLTNSSTGFIAGTGTIDLDDGSGTGTFGTLYNYGTLLPGDVQVAGDGTFSTTIGTLSLNGHLNMAPGSVLAVDVASADNYDRLRVAGTTTFEGLRFTELAGVATTMSTTTSTEPPPAQIQVTYAPGASFTAGSQFNVLSSADLLVELEPQLVGAAELALAPRIQGAGLSLMATSDFPVPLPPPPVLTGSTADQIATLLNGDHALAAEVIAEMDTNPLTTFTELLLQEEEKQAEDSKGLDNLVDNNQCRR